MATELIGAIDQLLEEDPEAAQSRTWELYCRRDADRAFALNHIRRRREGRINGPLWEQGELAALTAEKLLVNFCNMAPLSSRGSITFIHDAHVFMMPESHTMGYAAWYRFALPKVAAAASRVVTVSEFSRDRLVEFGVAPAGKIEVIHNGCEHLLRRRPDRSILDRLGLGPNRFVLALANRQPHKNIGVLFKAWGDPALADVKLVLVGPHDREAFSATGRRPPDSAVFAGQVSDEELRALYEAAICFASPSLMEGFGLPALEAMSLSCPVIAAPCGSLPEVCGEAAIYADPHDPAAWAEAVSTCRSIEARSSLQARGRERAARFSWRAGARRLLELIEEVAPCARETRRRLEEA